MKKIIFAICILSVKIYALPPVLVLGSVGVQNHFPLTKKFDVKEMFQTAGFDFGSQLLAGRYIRLGARTGGVILFGPQAKFFDAFSTLSIDVYPFQDYLSIGGQIGLSPTFWILNNISFISSVKISIDIPIVREHYITISSGIFYRGFIPMIDYIKFDNYRKKLSSYFVGLEYKFLLKADKLHMPRRRGYEGAV